MSLTERTDGMPPLFTDSDVRRAFDEWLLEEYEKEGPKPTAADTRLRVSNAFVCSRDIGFQLLDIPWDVPMEAKTVLTFKVGDFYHSVLQAALEAKLGARCEVVADHSSVLSLSGSADALYVLGVYDSPIRTALEAKSMGSYGFQLAVGVDNWGRKTKEPPGPKVEHIVQCALYAVAPEIDAERLHIYYFNKDNQAQAEWIIGLDEPLLHVDGSPTPRDLVDAEMCRLEAILADVDSGVLPARFIPGHGYVDKPMSKEHWRCRFCHYRASCAELATGPVDIVKKGE